MRPIHLILGSYNSQALDLMDTDRDALYEKSYKPFLKLLYNHEDTRFTMYYSGLLIEWLEKHHSEFVDVLTEMVKRKQVELLGGAYFEPMLPLIPKTDRIGQIERLTTHIRKNFGRRPRGAWVPESVWDQRIAANLNAGGLEYAFLRDTAFRFGPDNGNSAGHWPVLTEDQGKTLTLVPLAWDITGRMFHEPPEAIIESLRRIADDGTEGVTDSDRAAERPIVSLLFNGSRLGYRKNGAEESIEWYTRFLELVKNNRDWISMNTPRHILRRQSPFRRSYAPVSSFAGLMQWIEPFVREDSVVTPPAEEPWHSFRSVMEQYPESARLYARMQHTHVLVNQVRGDKYRKMTAREELWRGQSHYAYWHNRTGGIYRSSLRKATYAALIEAEKTTRERGIFIQALSRVDVDLDGEEELLFQGNEINAYLDRRGGRLFELDYLPKNWNYLDTFQRRPEPFHDAAARAAGYDPWPRSAFVDHMLSTEQDFAEFRRGEVSRLCDLSTVRYEIEQLDKDHNTVTFAATCLAGKSFAEIDVRKMFRFTKNRIEVEYTLSNTSLEPLSAQFATEINLSFHSLEVGKLRLHVRRGRNKQEIPPDADETEAVSDMQFQDLHNHALVTINPSDRPNVWSFPVEAVGILWDRPHWFYQSNCTVVRWPLELPSGDSKRFSVSLKIEPAS